MSLQYIRNVYGVPAFRGTRVRFTPDSRDKPEYGRVMSERHGHVRLRMDSGGRPYNCHPVWAMEYMTPDGWWSPETRRHSPQNAEPK